MLILMLGVIVATIFVVCVAFWGAIWWDFFTTVHRWVAAVFGAAFSFGIAAFVAIACRVTDNVLLVLIGGFSAATVGFLILWFRSTPAQRAKIDTFLGRT